MLPLKLSEARGLGFGFGFGTPSCWLELEGGLLGFGIWEDARPLVGGVSYCLLRVSLWTVTFYVPIYFLISLHIHHSLMLYSQSMNFHS